jgi:hypothetical protein
VLRVEVEWPDDADVDVHIWSASGAHASTKTPNGIAGVSFSGDVEGGAPTPPAKNVEQVFAQPNDKLVVGVCNNGSEVLRTPSSGALADVKVTVFEGATARSLSALLVHAGEGSYAFTSPAGPELPPHPANWCWADRASFTWDNAGDVDLHVTDAFGNHASQANPTGIPDAYLTPDDTDGFGPEEFIDRRFESGRQLYFFYCVDNTNGVTLPPTGGFWEPEIDIILPPGTFGQNVRLTNASFVDGEEGYIADSPDLGGGSSPVPPPAGWCLPDPPP